MTKITDDNRPDIESRLEAGESLRSVARSYGVAYQTLQYHRRIWGASPLRPAHLSGPEHPSWHGGEYVDRWGYKMVRAPERETCNPYTPEHILIAERKLGRRLLKQREVVHHLDGDKRNNVPENLLVCTKSQHRVLHRQLEEIGYELIRRGWISFVEGEYRLLV